MTKDVLFEKLLMVLLKDQVAFKFLLKDRLNKKHPNLFYSNDRLPDSGIVLDDSVEKFAECFRFLVERDHYLVVFTDFGPYLSSQIRAYLLIARVSHISGAVIEHLAIEAVERITFRKGFINQEIVIIGVPSLELLLCNHLEVLELIDQSVSDAMHKLFDAFLEDVE